MTNTQEPALAAHVHHWTWEMYDIYDGEDDPAQAIEGMKCACGERLNVDQVQDIVNRPSAPLAEAERAVVDAAVAERLAEIKTDELNKITKSCPLEHWGDVPCDDIKAYRDQDEQENGARRVRQKAADALLALKGGEGK